jgi:hypothetical protein
VRFGELGKASTLHFKKFMWSKVKVKTALRQPVACSGRAATSLQLLFEELCLIN